MTPLLDALQQFHFLRPLWLLALLPATLLLWLLLRQKTGAANWQGAISEKLLAYLSDGAQSPVSRLPLYGLWLAWLIAAVALAGPTWNTLPQPVHQRQDALVIVLDLSLSMLAEDIKPSRLTRARHKVLDILHQRREGLTALVAYSGDAHIVAPLTDDTPTIANLVPALSPLMMPVIGSNPVAAIDAARELLRNAGIIQGRLLLITDGITGQDLDALGDNNRQGIELAVMGVGTAEGAPIPADKGYLKDDSGNIIVPQLERAPLRQLASSSGGRYADLTLDNRDIEFLLPANTNELEENTVLTEREFDQWHDRGPLFALLLIPFALAAFRRGWLLTLLLPLFLTPERSFAFEWQDLWQRPDQQGAARLEAGDAEGAAKVFEDPRWKGSARYRAEDFAAAAETFAQLDNADAHYNRGNALARAGKLDEAIAAYEQALQQQPDLEDARFNKELVEQLLQQQQSQQNQNQQDQSGEDGEQQSSSQQQSSQQQSAQQQSSQQSDQSSADQQSGQQQSSNSQQQADPQQTDQQQSNDTQADSAQENTPSPEQQQTLSDTSLEQEQQQASAAQANETSDKENSDPQNAAQEAVDPATEQQRQATEQWLRQIPDDPSGLLRRKFYYESQLRQQQGQLQQEQPQW